MEKYQHDYFIMMENIHLMLEYPKSFHIGRRIRNYGGMKYCILIFLIYFLILYEIKPKSR